ncbi:MAG: glycosyltransferase [Candidatus Hydrogenedentes bacterium]|nr:glycosyltransferase [Candidatus Hydrogenedentota bacterium]
MLVSVVLPFRNAVETLRTAIESIQSQTFADWELLLYDDGSDDGSTAIAAECSNTDSRIRIVGHERVGIVAALQHACESARGAYIARMDADDISHAARFERQLSLMRQDESIALCGCLVRATGADLGEGGRRYHEWINSIVEHDAISREIFVECPLAHPTFFLRRSAFERIGGYKDRGWAEDYDLVLRLWQAGERFAKIPEVLLDWRNAPDRLSQTDSRYSPGQFQKLKQHFLEVSELASLGSRAFVQWGAGEVGKRWLRAWDTVRPSAVVDIHPRKIGTRIHGYPVIAPEGLPPSRSAYVLVAVGAPGAREEIRGWFAPRGYEESRDYRFIA